MQEIIKKYFNSWIEKDASVIEESFSNDIIYIECYGPVYNGKNQCLKWFEDWNLKSSVIKWDIKNIKSIENMSIVEWYFECEYEGNVDGFDGVSIIEFDNDKKIISVKEFQSKSQHFYPYEK